MAGSARRGFAAIGGVGCTSAGSRAARIQRRLEMNDNEEPIPGEALAAMALFVALGVALGLVGGFLLWGGV